MEPKRHTPGPWRWTAVEGGWDGVESDHGLICRLVLNEQANARLIAAAPELLAACRAALSLGALGESIGIADAMDRSSAKATARLESIEAQIIAAIAKAEGKT